MTAPWPEHPTVTREMVDYAREASRDALARGEVITYGEIADHFGLHPNGSTLGWALHHLNEEDPVAAANVVNKDSREPGVGYYKSCADLGITPLVHPHHGRPEEKPEPYCPTCFLVGPCDC